MIGMTGICIDMARGLAVLGETVVPVRDTGRQGELHVGGPDGPVLRPLTFGERTRLVARTAWTPAPREAVCACILRAATVRAGKAEQVVQEVLALHLAGAGLAGTGAQPFAEAALLVAREAGMDLARLDEVEAMEIDRLAAHLAGPATGQGDWCRIIIGPGPASAIQGLRDELADDLLARGNAAPRGGDAAGAPASLEGGGAEAAGIVGRGDGPGPDQDMQGRRDIRWISPETTVPRRPFDAATGMEAEAKGPEAITGDPEPLIRGRPVRGRDIPPAAGSGVHSGDRVRPVAARILGAPSRTSAGSRREISILRWRLDPDPRRGNPSSPGGSESPRNRPVEAKSRMSDEPRRPGRIIPGETGAGATAASLKVAETPMVASRCETGTQGTSASAGALGAPPPMREAVPGMSAERPVPPEMGERAAEFADGLAELLQAEADLRGIAR